MSQSSSAQSSSPQKNGLEWFVFAFSAILVTGVLGYLIFAAFSMGNTPPAFAIKLDAPQRAGEWYRVPVEIKNNGDQSGENVEIEVVLKTGEGEETSSFTVAFSPRHSLHEGAVFFKTDPKTGTLEARVLGYEKP